MRRGCQKVHFQHGQSELKCSFGQSLFVRMEYEETGRFEDEPKREKKKQGMGVLFAVSFGLCVECGSYGQGKCYSGQGGGRICY